MAGRIYCFIALIYCAAALCLGQDILLLSSGKAEHKKYATLLETRLKSCGIAFKSKTEAALTANDLNEASVVILPSDSPLEKGTNEKMSPYFARGGKLVAFYRTDAAVLKHLGLKKVQYKLHKSGAIQSVSFENGLGALSCFPAHMAHRTNSVMVPTLEPGTLKIGTWLNGEGKPLGTAATLGKNGIYFCAAYLDQDMVNGGDFLLAALALYSQDVWRQYAQCMKQSVLTFAGENTVAQLRKRIARCGSSELETLLDKVCDTRNEADNLFNQGKHYEAVALYRKVDALSEQVFIESAVARPSELRGVWCHSAYGVPGYSWDQVVRQLSLNGFNALFMNACWADLADYPSEVLWNAPDVAKRGDQIALCLAACRKYGVELHIWRVCWNLGYRYPADKLAAMKAAHRTQQTAKGEDSAFLAPHLDENISLELDAIEEIARKYKVDGIHLDYIRYASSRYDYSDSARKAFENALGRQVANWPRDCQEGGCLFKDFCSWRCDNITNMLDLAKKRIERTGSKAKLSVAVYPEWNNSPEWIGQDVRTWIEKGLVDFVCPMDYSADMEEYSNWLQAQYDYNRGRVPVYIGIGLYKLKGNVPSLQQLELARKLGHDGFVCFDLKKSFLDEVLPNLGLAACKGRAGAIPHQSRQQCSITVQDGEKELDGAFRKRSTVTSVVELPKKLRNDNLSVAVELNGIDLGEKGISTVFTKKGLRVQLNAEKAGRYRLRIENGNFVARSPVIRVLSSSEVKQLKLRKGPPQFAENGGIKVGVWHDNAYGAQPILDALVSNPKFDAAILYNLDIDNLAKCQVLVLPQVRRNAEIFKSDATADALREYVHKGGALLVTHAMVGTRSFPNLFPNVVKNVQQVALKERNWCYSRRGKTRVLNQSSFVDMIEMTPGPDGSKFLETPKGQCVMVYGNVGEGRYAACGLGIGIAPDDKDTALSKQEKSLLFKTVKLLAR